MQLKTHVWHRREASHSMHGCTPALTPTLLAGECTRRRRHSAWTPGCWTKGFEPWPTRR